MSAQHRNDGPEARGARPSIATGIAVGLLALLLVCVQIGFGSPSGADPATEAGVDATAAGPELIDVSSPLPDGGVVVPPEPAAPTPVVVPVDDATAARWAAHPDEMATEQVAALGGTGAWSAPEADAPEADGTLAQPSAPTNHKVYGQAGGAFQRWDVPADLGGKPITGYLVHRATTPDFTQNLFLGTTFQQSFDWSNLAAGSVFWFRVSAQNADGFGPFTAGFSITVPQAAAVPSAVLNVKASALPESARITWAVPVSTGGSAITGYVIRINEFTGLPVKTLEVPADPRSVVVSGLPSWADAFTYVAAITANGLGQFSAFNNSAYFVPTELLEPNCSGTGSDGKRIEVLYAYAGAAPDPESLLAANGFTARMEKMLDDSAAASGGVRNFRWRTDDGAPGCELVITPVQVPADLGSDVAPHLRFSQRLRPLLAGPPNGFNADNRKYFTWVEQTSVTPFADPALACAAQWTRDENRGENNFFNTTTLHAACPLNLGIGFGGGHELMHVLGAVQDGAPNSDNNSHCTENYDPLCNQGSAVNPQCADQFVYYYLFDCGHDDYFNTNPLPGTYLCEFWNTARSVFLTNNLDDSIPSAPLATEALAGNTQATISWTTPAQQSCPGITDYEVTASPAPPGGATKTSAGTGTSFVFTGLTNGTPYTFTVKAKSGIATGPASAPTNPVTPNGGGVVPPGAPTGAAAVPANLSATVNWTAPVANGGGPILGYRITTNPGGAVTDVGNVLEGTVTGLTDLQSYTFTVRARNSAGFGPPSSPTGPVTPTALRTFHGLTPVRILDSRPAPETVGAFATPWGPTTTRDIPVGGTNGVPADASAVVMNVTAVGPSEASFLTLWPKGAAKPTASNLNFAQGDVIPNLVVVKLGDDGKVSIFNNSGTVNVLADVVGYFDGGGATGSKFNGVTPKRILDSRPGGENVGTPPTKFSQGQTRDLLVQGVTPIPGNATDVVLNVTVTGPSESSFLTLWPKGAPKPTASNLNFKANQTIPNLVVAKVGAEGKISIFNNSGNVDVIADVVGYFSPTGGTYTPVVPVRILDSRPGPENVGLQGTWQVDSDRELIVAGSSPSPVPVGATAVVLNVTVVNGQAPFGLDSFLTVYPSPPGPFDPGNRPTASNLNFGPGKVIPNLVMVPLGVDGKIRIYNRQGFVNVIADVVGYYK